VDRAVEVDGLAVNGNLADRDRPGVDVVGVAEGEGDVCCGRRGLLRACRNHACRNDEKQGCRGAKAAREASKHGSSPGVDCTASGEADRSRHYFATRAGRVFISKEAA